MAKLYASAQDIWIYGLDTEEDEKTHDYFDERTHYKVEESSVLNMIATDGNEVAVICRKATGEESPEIPKGELICADGRQRIRRIRAACVRLAKAGEPEIRVYYVLDSGSQDNVPERMEGINSHRVADSPMIRAAKCLRLKNRGNDVKACAQHFGVSDQTVRNWLKLTEAPAAVRTAVDKGRVTMTDAVKLAKEEDPKEALATLLADQSRAQAKKKVGQRGKPTKPKAPAKKIREAMANDEGTSLKKSLHYLLMWSEGQCSLEEAIKYVPGFEASYKRAKSRVKREMSKSEKDETKAAKTRAKPKKPAKKVTDTDADPTKVKSKPKGKKAKPKKKAKEKKAKEKTKTAAAPKTAADLPPVGGLKAQGKADDNTDGDW